MNIINISNLGKYNYSISVVNGLKQYWKDSCSFSCINNPKNVNILLYLDGCDAIYTDKNNKTLTAKSGNIIYTPIGSEYMVKFINFQKENSNTIGVNFFLSDQTNTPFVLSEDITVFATQDKSYKLFFAKIDNASERLVMDYAQMKSGMYDILSSLYQESTSGQFDRYNIISRGIMYMEQENNPDLSIRELAGLCNVSETYFRRLFREYSGMSPVEYITHHKIKRAKIYLKYENISITEIAEKLFFTSPSYFIKTFKEHTGITPKEYRNKNLS